MKTVPAFGPALGSAVKCLALLTFVWCGVPAAVVLVPEPAFAAQSQEPSLYQRYVGRWINKLKPQKKTETPPKKTEKKRHRSKSAKKARRAKKRAVAVAEVPKPVPRPPLPAELQSDATPSAATAVLADAPPEGAPTEVSEPPDWPATEPPPAELLAPEVRSETPVGGPPEPPAWAETDTPAAGPPGTPSAGPDDPRSRKVALGGEQTAMVVIPRPRPPARPEVGEPAPAAPLATNGNWRPEEVRAARLACEAELSGLDLAWEESTPLGGPRGCGAAAPIRLRYADGVRLSPPALANCRMAAAFHRWIKTVVQPAAEQAFAERVTGLSIAASYDCRYRYNAAGGKVSEHARANAIDVSGFTLASGNRVEVLGGWQPKLVSLSGSGRFLRDVHTGGCTMFSTVLGPEANAAHASHFHFDLQARNRRFRMCE